MHPQEILSDSSFPSPPHDTHPPWMVSHVGGSRSAASPPSLAVCFIPLFLTRSRAGVGGIEGMQGVSYAQSGLQGRTNFYHGVIGFWKFQLGTELGGLV